MTGIQIKVEGMLAERQELCKVLHESDLNQFLGANAANQAKLSVDSRIEFDFNSRDIGLSWEGYQQSGRELAACWCEQKWNDLILGHLTNQLTMSSGESARLLHGIRTRYASIVERFSRMHSDALWYASVKDVVLEIFDKAAGSDRSISIEEYIHWLPPIGESD